MNDKIQPHHLERLAIVYKRQSSGKQVRNNKESQKRQRALAKRAQQLGWADEKILVLEEEKARSGRSTVDRTAYRKVSELVCQNQVGIILAVEVSRWSRDSIAWQLLLRDCVYGGVLYERFFEICRKENRTVVRSCTSPVNKGSVEFHKRMGFEIDFGDEVVDGIPVSGDYNRPGDHKVLFSKTL